MKIYSIQLFFILLFFSCTNDDVSKVPVSFTVSGQVVDAFGNGLQGVQIFYNESDFVLSNPQGNWTIENLVAPTNLQAVAEQYTFTPNNTQVNSTVSNLVFTATKIPSQIEIQIFNWFLNQQLPNGLVGSVENGNTISLYDNALASMVFMLRGDFPRAKRIFDFFNARIDSELANGVGGFAQFRDINGIPSNHRWMGDNAWLLIALNNYKHLTGLNTYDALSTKISQWLIGLQDTDGGLFAGYGADNQLLNYKVTEGNIDAFNAVVGFNDFHSKVLNYLKINRWNAPTKSLVSWPENPPYLFALDLHPWSYCIFENFPMATLNAADRFLTTQTAVNAQQVTGYCFDEDKDTVWIEGTGQMALAWGLAGLQSEKEFYLTEMEKVLIQSNNFLSAKGFPYATNPGTAYGADPLWSSAPTAISVSGGAWYLFAQYNFNPFGIQRIKNIPLNEQFWQ